MEEIPSTEIEERTCDCRECTDPHYLDYDGELLG